LARTIDPITETAPAVGRPTAGYLFLRWSRTLLSIRKSLAFPFAGVLLLLLGCGTSPAPVVGDICDVTGTVTTASGGPMKVGTIHFKNDGGGRDELCVVNDGKFALKMFAGNYKVAFDVDEPRSAVPAKFRSYATSGKTAEVKSGSDDLQFQLK
jgi:hypothetical protein